ncbi:PD-(D/E)XK nuclease family protein [Campylobacter curvus]|uniref:PD-(D/E)XK nuclease family protein n=1 Tax=Campylobacter curvus TaxID=200 RepID=UPI0014701BC5|nr:PD-(D/E)XK nuclease family protein [Campylobacter curvus]
MQDLKPMDYEENYKDLIPEGAFRISPSSIYQFTSEKWNWYRSQILGEKLFEGNKYTILGSCVHRIAESYIKTKDVNRTEIVAYIDKQSCIDTLDKEWIKDQWRPMGQALIDYLRVFGIPERSEEAIAYELYPNVFVGGTADAVIGDTLVDYKTTSKTTPDTFIPKHYKWQLLTYAYIYRKMGLDITRIRIVWVTNNIVNRISEKTGKPMKDYPSSVVPVTELITDDDMRFIEDYLKLIAETYLKSKENPELTYLLYSDYRLKN